MKQPNSIVLITVDCLRADHCGFLSYSRPTTPFLDALSAKSFVFRNAIAAGAPTYHALQGILASRHPLALGRDVVGLAPGETTLASELRASGYKTGAFLAGNPYLSRRYGYDSGFEEFEDFMGAPTAPREPIQPKRKSLRSRAAETARIVSRFFGPTRRIYNELNFRYHMRAAKRSIASLDQMRRYPPADVMVSRARQWLTGAGSQPFFLWLHLMDPHGPYFPPVEAQKMLGKPALSPSHARYLNDLWTWIDVSPNQLKSHRDELLFLYDAGIRWVDTQVGVLVEALQQLGIWQNCVFAFTADHGEEFLEHGGTGHFPPKVTEELIHVPLLLHAPDMTAGSGDTPFSLVHLAPTLLEAAGFPAPENFRGISHWTRLDDELSWKSPVIAEVVWSNPCQKKQVSERILAVRDGPYKLVIDFRARDQQMFNLATDPGELHPMPADEEKPRRRRLLEQAGMHLADSMAATDPGLRVNASLRELRMQYAGLK